jgi:hypothetical protein
MKLTSDFVPHWDKKGIHIIVIRDGKPVKVYGLKVIKELFDAANSD